MTQLFIVSPMKPKDEGRLDVSVKFNNGKTYHVSFVNSDYIEFQLGGLAGCVAISGMIVLDEVSMDRAREVLPGIIKLGFFNSLVPVDGDEDGE